jgi:hypothetical protein
MPEGRMLKKVISESKKIGTLPSDSARLLYTWLIPWLDVEGRHSADPEIIKGHVFPKVKSMSTKKIERLVHELNEGRLIILYIFDGEIYLQFKKTLQKIDKTREAASTIPEPKKGQIIKPTHENSGVTHENSSISKVNESKVKLNKSKSSCPKKVSDVDIKLTELLISKILKNNPKSGVQRKTEKTKDDWMNECRKLREIDKRTPEEIKSVIDWCQDDEFEKTVVLSMPKLRKRFDNLWMKSQRGRSPGKKEPPGKKEWIDKKDAEEKS